MKAPRFFFDNMGCSSGEKVSLLLPFYLIHYLLDYGILGNITNFNQSGARKQSFLTSDALDWLKFETLPQKTPHSLISSVLKT